MGLEDSTMIKELDKFAQALPNDAIRTEFYRQVLGYLNLGQELGRENRQNLFLEYRKILEERAN